jgi:integrase
MSIHRTKYNTYIVRWRCDGKEVSKTFRSKDSAAKFDAKVRLAELPVKKIETAQMSFREFADEFITNYAMVSKEESSVHEDRSVLKNHLIPSFGSYRIGMIDYKEASQVRMQLVKSGLNRKTINNIFALLKRMLTVAVRWGYLPHNPVAHLEPLKFQGSEMKFWSFDESDRYLDYIQPRNLNLYEIVAFALNTGLRYGEQRGLLRDCLDFQRREIIVKRSWCSRTNKLIQRTKGKKERRVPMNQLVFDMLRRRFREVEGEFIFPFNLSNLRNRLLVTSMARAGVPRIRFHDFRHSFASQLVMSGVPLFKVKELMGHSDYKTTLRYTHLAPDQLDGITEVLLRTRKSENSVEFDSLRKVVS